MKVHIYTDGSAKGNPGAGGYGTVISYEDSRGKHCVVEFSQGYVNTTNNRMELMGAIAGLEALEKSCEVEIISDSKYLVDAFQQNWIESWIKNDWRRGKKEPVKNVDLWKRLLQAMETHTVTFTWIKGHNGHPQNERCDYLATIAADGEDLLIDEGMQ